jgi:hypothetical protein
MGIGIAQTALAEFENGSPEKEFAKRIGRYDEQIAITKLSKTGINNQSR